MADSKCPDIELIHRYASGDEMSDSEKKLAESHIKECKDCRKEYDSIVATIKLLTGYWDGKTEDCFDSETLAEYLAGLADEVTSKRIEGHVRECVVCSYELDEMRKIEAVPDTAPPDIEIPSEVDERIFAKVMAARDEALMRSVKQNFMQTARNMTNKFISMFHEAEKSLVESIWKMFSDSYNRDVTFGKLALSTGVSAVAGGKKDVQTPAVMFTMLGVCDYLSDFDSIPDEKKLRDIVTENAKRFDVSRAERRKLEDFLVHELLGKKQ